MIIYGHNYRVRRQKHDHTRFLSNMDKILYINPVAEKEGDRILDLTINS